jgi:hypothetical protein
MSLNIKAQNVQADDMLIPYHEYGRQGEYLVVGGFILQKLTRKYLSAWGDNWSGRVDPHLYDYYRESAFMPGAEREDIVILSRVLPAEINLGYQDLKQLVVTKYNGQAIRSMRDVVEARKLNPEGKFDVLEFENDNPTVVLPRGLLPQADTLISRLYGIETLHHIEE